MLLLVVMTAAFFLLLLLHGFAADDVENPDARDSHGSGGEPGEGRLGGGFYPGILSWLQAQQAQWRSNFHRLQRPQRPQRPQYRPQYGPRAGEEGEAAERQGLVVVRPGATTGIQASPLLLASSVPAILGQF